MLANPGVEARRDEIVSVLSFFENSFRKIEKIESPGTLDGGDVLEVDDKYFIGISKRTNKEGACQFLDILSRYDKKGTVVPVGYGLHLKSSISYLGNNYLLIDSNSINIAYFSGYNFIFTEINEEYVANSININGTVIIPEGSPKTQKKLADIGFSIRTINLSEFRKLDGGLSCLSLRL